MWRDNVQGGCRFVLINFGYLWFDRANCRITLLLQKNSRERGRWDQKNTHGHYWEFDVQTQNLEPGTPNLVLCREADFFEGAGIVPTVTSITPTSIRQENIKNRRGREGGSGGGGLAGLGAPAPDPSCLSIIADQKPTARGSMRIIRI